MKNQKGITLIALVITIIVLLILAGVSISMVIGDNGILRQATDAKTKTNAAIAEEKEKLQDNADWIDEYVSGGNGTSFISEITEENYGDYVNYEVDLGITSVGTALSDGEVPKTDWRIFYKDATNVYLIASDFLPTSKFPSGVFGNNNGKYNGYWSASDGVLTTSGIITSNTKFLFNKLSNVTEGNLNYQAVATLLDTTKWKEFAKEGYVDDVNNAVIGSPTVEMWMASWNERYEGETLSFDANEIGYQIGLTADNLSTNIDDSTAIHAKEGFNNTLYYPHGDTSGTAWNSCRGYYLASPSASVSKKSLVVVYNGGLGCNYYYLNNFGVRPVVSLKSNISATKDDNDVWQLGN